MDRGSAIGDAHMREMVIEDMIDLDVPDGHATEARAGGLRRTRRALHTVDLEDLSDSRAIGLADADDRSGRVFADDRSAHEKAVADALGEGGRGAEHGEASKRDGDLLLEQHGGSLLG